MRKIFLTFSLLLLLSGAFAQQVLMQGWYWDYPKTTGGYSWADTLRIKAAELKTAGFTHVWFPPHTVASSGASSNGFDPKDLFIGNQTTGLGTRNALNNMLAEFTARGIYPVGDLTYNHRDGGDAENNPAVQAYITNYYTAAKEPYPSDRFRCILPLGGASANGAGDYYFKIASKTGNNRFNNFGYKVYMQTNTVGNQGPPDLTEVEPNGGADCAQPNNNIFLGKNMLATVETTTGCNTDEFHLHINAGDFNPAGDTLFIYLTNTGVGYSDHRIYGIYSAVRGTDIISDLIYQTYTNFNTVASGRGKMDYDFFKPNNANASTTYLNGNLDTMYFFYDYDQNQKKTADTLIEWTKWNWDVLGVRGIRMDAAKHFAPSFVGKMLDTMHLYGKDPNMVLGEWYSANTTELSTWVNNVVSSMSPATQAAIKPKIYDFALREQLRQSCDNSGYDCRNVFTGSLHDASGLSGQNIVTFINNHDFRDMTGFNSLVRNNPDLAYAYVLTNNQLGIPSIFYPDYYGYPLPSGGMYGYHPTNLPPYKPQIDRLIAIYENLIYGSPSVDFLNRFGTPYTSNFISGSSGRALIYQIQGFAGNNNRDMIVAINFGTTTLKVDQQINNRLGVITTGTRFNDILGNSAYPYQLVNASGQVYIELPPKTYSIWVEQIGPVASSLLSFRGQAESGRNELFWNVTNEISVASYIIERSVNGTDFTATGTVAALNAPNGVAAYNYVDANLPPTEYTWYRLKILDKDGVFKYSNIITIKRELVFDAAVFPNPVKGNTVTVTITSPVAKSISARVYNMEGQLLCSQVIAVVAGVNTYPLSQPVVSGGTYALLLDDGVTRIKKQFIKN
jgi:alpha-amylase